MWYACQSQGYYFKYRKFDKSSLELLLNRELWFAKADTLNDPFEASSSFSNVLNAVLGALSHAPSC